MPICSAAMVLNPLRIEVSANGGDLLQPAKAAQDRCDRQQKSETSLIQDKFFPPR
jgi:hypothetical protein